MIEFLSKQKSIAILVSIFLTVVGFLFFIHSPKESLPEIKLGFIVIKTVYPNSTPEEVEKLITIPIEDAVKNIKGIKEINSTSSESASIIILSLDEKIKNTETILNSVKNSISKINNLPDDIIGPDITEITTDEFPILQIAIYGTDDYENLRKATNLLYDRITKIKGVARVDKIGYFDKVVYICVDNEKLKNYAISIFSIINSIKSKNFTIPAGYKELKDKEYGIRTVSEINNIKDIENIIIRSNESGNITTVKNVAQVKESFIQENIKIKANQKQSIILTVFKSRAEDTIKINKEIKNIADDLKKILPENILIKFFNDSSKFIKDRIDLVNSNGVLGGIFVFFVILLLIKPSVSVLVAISVPIVFGASLAIIKFIGLTYDMLSLFGFVMAIGLIVDNSIVIGENFYRYLNKEKDLDIAIKNGVKDVFKPVLASTLTTIASFSPLLFIGGILGSFLRPIPTVVIITIFTSYIVAYLILPALLRGFVKVKENKFTEWQEDVIEYLKSIYQKFLEFVFKRKILFVFLTILTFIFSVFIILKQGVSFFTTQIDQIEIKIKTKPDYSLEQTEKVINKIEEVCMTLNEDDLETVYTYIGRQDGTNGIPEISTNFGQINIVLKLESERKTKDINKIISFLQEKIGKPEGVEKLTIGGVRREGGGARPDVSIDVTGNDSQRVKIVSDEVLEIIKNVKGVTNAFTDYEEGKSEFKFVIDERKTAILGVSPSQIGTTLRAYISGIEITRIKIKGEEVKIILKADSSNLNSIEDILNLTVPNLLGKNILLKNLVSIEESKSFKKIKHKDTKNCISVFASIDRKKANPAAVNSDIFKKLQQINKQYPDVIIKASGEFKEMMENFQQLTFAFLTALFLIYIILTALFNSFIQPFIMMLTVPFGFIGVAIALLIHKMPVSFAAFMGFVALSGVVVNNSIVLNDFVNKMKLNIKEKEKAIIEACKIRLRPILLTSVTTLVGLIPVGYGLLGSKDAFLQPVAIVFAWGLLFSTFITLFIVPIFIYFFNKNNF